MGIKNYNEVINALTQFANAHLSLKRFKTSFFEQIDNFATAENSFPILYAVPTDVTFEEQIDVMSMRIYCVDILQKDRSNEQSILNETLLVLRDLVNWIRETSTLDLNVVGTPRAVPINNFLTEFTVGFYIDLSVETSPETNDCSIPFSSNFQYSGITCDYTYVSQFLTCDTVASCQSIIDIQNQLNALSGSTGVAGNNDVGVMYLKNNTTATTITTINQRKVVEGDIQTGILSNFIKDPSTNSLKYTGLGGRFHIISTFNFFEGNQNICGFYIGKNTNPSSPLDPDADRISESEIYINSSNPSTQPVNGAIQTVLDLNTNDRVFFIVQNKDAATNITVEFMKYTVTSLTAEKGVSGSTGPAGPAGGGLKYFSSASSGETVIGTTNNTFTKALFVPANSYTTDDVPEVSVRARRVTGTTGNGAYTTRLYWNTSPSISGSPVLLAVAPSVTNINNSSFMSRNIAIVDATSLSNVTDLAGGYSTDSGTNGNGTIARAPSDVVVDWTQDGYLVVAITFTSSLGSAYCNLIRIR
jgi:hypothetical protein